MSASAYERLRSTRHTCRRAVAKGGAPPCVAWSSLFTSSLNQKLHHWYYTFSTQKPHFSELFVGVLGFRVRGEQPKPSQSGYTIGFCWVLLCVIGVIFSGLIRFLVASWTSRQRQVPPYIPAPAPGRVVGG